ncbi:carbon-nitrogen hydrolase family protein [Alteribacter aurantiacus]|uniref:carbon-nitrogen hydrolase family protein n=1 Tax=Alteribacter aurantiacus TaxID=254410 RepID=UPI00041E3013|nr:carbon-nitrogen hydrolase family protein [Alteribacter aurantiacus]
MKIAGCQIIIPSLTTVAERNAHINEVMKRTKEALIGKDVDLLVFPELSTISYNINTFAHINELAEERFGYSYKAFATLAKELQAHVCYGLPLKENGSLFISQVVIDPQGDYVIHYNKIHLAQFGASAEKQYFTRGNHLSEFEIKGFTFGLMICYDMRFPELARSYALDKNVDCLLHPVAFYKDQSYPSWHAFVQTRSLENQVYMLSLNQAGQSYGNSIFCPPWIDYDNNATNYGGKEQFLTFELTKEAIKQSRTEYTLREDRWEPGTV